MNDRLKKVYRKLQSYPIIIVPLCYAARFLETLLFGGVLRELILVHLLGALHRSQYRRNWLFSPERPHFYNQRWNGYAFTYGQTRSPYVFIRGFLSCEILKDGDSLLDIGCGDGFFSNSFFSAKCRHIDAIDIDKAALRQARRLNSNPKIDFYVLDAVHQPFPSDRYDVIVWDGAIGHFSRSDLSTVLEKIHRATAPDGIFVGSESLGKEGSDHLWYFENEADLAAVLKPHFQHVLIRTVEYRIEAGLLRREAYWRCANGPNVRHMATTWTDFS